MKINSYLEKQYNTPTIEWIEISETNYNIDLMTIKISGVLDNLTTTTASGWVNITGTNYNADSKPYIKISVCNDIVAEGFAQTSRPDIEKLGGLSFGFSLNLKIDNLNLMSNLSVKAKFHELETTLKIYKPIELLMQFSSLPTDQQVKFISSIVPKLDNSDYQFTPKNFLITPTKTKDLANKLCVITYANDATAWFPYFYQYYARLVGESGIYVITPKPESFSSYKFGGLITSANMIFDNNARITLMSEIATGLQAYYKWTLVCDVDEIVVPNPHSGLDFFDLLEKHSQEKIIVSRGLDILQMPNEEDFSFHLPILEQRRFGYPNMALYKPHLSSVPIQYSTGHHYCNYKLTLPSINECFLTLHLKFACKKIRQEVETIVKNTEYLSKETADYSISSISEHNINQKHDFYLSKKVRNLNSKELREFEKSYSANLEFSFLTGLWTGTHMSAPFIIDLLK